MPSSILTATASAGGAPIGQLSIIAALYIGGSALLMALVLAHRSGRTQVLARFGDSVGSWVGLPGWAAVPVLISSISLLTVMCGGFWDIGYHIDYGRDAGPLGNPGHYPLMFGFFGTFAAAILGIGLADRRDATRAWISLTDSWPIPVGCAIVLLSSAFGLAALPLDDVWHRIFGQDVTLWSPTHFMLLGGATFSVFGMLVLIAEGKAAATQGPRSIPILKRAIGFFSAASSKVSLGGGGSNLPSVSLVLSRGQRAALLGGMLVGFEGFLAEFDWGVPLYRQVWQVLFLMAGAAFVFSAARSWAGRGGAILAWVVYVAVRLLASLMPVIAGRSLSVLSPLLAGAIVVELVAMWISPRRQWVGFALTAGAISGLVGFAAEYAWRNIAGPLPWKTALLAEGLPTAVLGGVAGALLGTLFAMAMRRELPPPRIARTACVGGLLLLVGLGFNASIKSVPQVTGDVQLSRITEGPKRSGYLTATLHPANAAENNNWFYVLAWQGGAGTQRVVAKMIPMGGGVWKTDRAIPFYGTWKSGLRLAKGRQRGALPLRLPSDRALPQSAKTLPGSFQRAGAVQRMRGSSGAELPAPQSFSRPFLDDALIVLREQKADVPQSLWRVSIVLVMGMYIAFIAAVALGIARFARRGGDRLDPPGAEDAEPTRSSEVGREPLPV